jgi:plastocyanin domain-containing protein
MAEPATEQQQPPSFRRMMVVFAVGMGFLVAIAIVGVVVASLSKRPPREVRATPGSGGVQELAVDVTSEGCPAGLLLAKAGEPLRLRAELREPKPRAARLAIPELKVELELPAKGAGVLELPAAPRGAYRVSCGEGRLKGTLVLE